MLEIPERIWKAIKGYRKPREQDVFRTNSQYVLCWKTTCLEDKTDVVIKLFEWDIIEDCKQELKAVKALMKINHPNLVRVYDIKEDDELGVYYVMEYWGDDLRESFKYLPRQEQTIDIIKQVLEGLSELHKKVGAHRDIKPENIFIKGGAVKIGDYGLVKSKRFVTELTTIAGTNGYMAPEVLSGKPYDERCDIYSVGIVLLELLTGTREATDTHRLTRNNIPEYLIKIIEKATAKEPERRFGSVEEFIDALNRKDAENAEIKDTPVTHIDRDGSGYGNGSGDGSGSGSGFGDGSGDGSGSGKKSTHLSPLLIEGKDKTAKNTPILLDLDIGLSYMKSDWHSAGLGILLTTLMTQFDDANVKKDYQKVLGIGEEICRNFGNSLNNKTLPVYLKVTQTLARLYYQMGNYSESSRLFVKCYSYTQNRTGPDANEPVSELLNLANSYLMWNKWDLAYQYYTQALLMVEKFPEDDITYLKHTLLEHILNNLAIGYYRQKNYDTACSLFKRALEHNSIAPCNHAIKIYNLALTYEAQGNKSMAESFYKRSLQIAEKTMKPDDERRKIIENAVNNL